MNSDLCTAFTWPNLCALVEMHDERFHFEIFKNFMKILKYFMKPLIFNIKSLKIFKNMIKVYQVSRRYIMLFMHNNKDLPLTGLLTSDRLRELQYE